MYMEYKIAGNVKLIQEPQTFASGFTKREVIVTVESGKYPQDISVEFLQDSVSKLDAIKEGDAVSVAFDIRGREHNGRYFNSLVGWGISVEGASAVAAPKEDNDPLPF
jgi:hypothetical protein